MEFGDASKELAEARTLAEGIVAHSRSVSRDGALESAARLVGVGKWTLWGLVYGQRKSITHGVLAALRREYLRIVERQVRQLEAELVRLREKSGQDHAFTSLAAEAESLVARLRQARSREP